MRYTILIIIFFILLPISTFAAVLDIDKDGLSDALETSLGTDLNNPDSDADGYKDGQEVYTGHDPLSPDKEKTSARRVEVDLAKQQLYYFYNNVKIGAMPVSTGLVSMPTPKGKFTIMRKVPVVNYIGPGYNLPNTKWNLEFKRHYYLHGAYWHNQFGKKPMSHGCVNIAYKNAEKLYNFLEAGDEVVVFGKTPHHVPQNIAKALDI
ncbi:murein L,D-transpeptidase [Patescibacteria group bacterium]|nr:MAG: murein L,D-transpeptidase [Patescibacteria group bacterium]